MIEKARKLVLYPRYLDDRSLFTTLLIPLPPPPLHPCPYSFSFLRLFSCRPSLQLSITLPLSIWHTVPVGTARIFLVRGKGVSGGHQGSTTRAPGWRWATTTERDHRQSSHYDNGDRRGVSAHP